MIPSLVFYSGSELLEGPVFDKENGLLYFVSILECMAYCYVPGTKEILSIKLDSPVSCIFPMGRKKVLAASKNGFYEIDFNSLRKQFAFQLDVDPFVRYNDGIEDPMGRILIGTMGYPEVRENVGKVFSYHEGKSSVIIDHTTISNGLAFSQDNDFLYFIDTPTQKVAKFSYEMQSGEVEFVANVIEFKGDGSPDGMCMDADGMLWIAEWGGGCVSRWNPLDGNKLDELQLPCTNVTSCCFDGASNLYVTTAKSDTEDDIYGGGLFYFELNRS